MSSRRPEAYISGLNATELLAFGRALFSKDDIGADAAAIVSALLINTVGARCKPFTFPAFVRYLAANGLDRCINIVLRRGDKLPVVALALSIEIHRWPAARRDAGRRHAADKLGLVASAVERTKSPERISL